MEYWQRMQAKTSHEPPLTDVEFRNEHVAALKQALQDFDSKRNIPNQYTEDVYKFNLTKVRSQLIIQGQIIFTFFVYSKHIIVYES